MVEEVVGTIRAFCCRAEERKRKGFAPAIHPVIASRVCLLQL